MSGFIPAPVKPQIAMADLDKIDIRVGTIERVDPVPRSDKLVRLTVDFGDWRRSVLAGLRHERADPKAEIEGRQALFVVNVAARKMAGEISEAMLFVSDTPTVSPRCSRYRKGRCPTACAQANPVRSAFSRRIARVVPSFSRNVRGDADAAEA
jgi:methionine--tRNA ligase beta chain